MCALKIFVNGCPAEDIQSTDLSRLQVKSVKYIYVTLNGDKFKKHKQSPQTVRWEALLEVNERDTIQNGLHIKDLGIIVNSILTSSANVIAAAYRAGRYTIFDKKWLLVLRRSSVCPCTEY